jgi:predicted metal-dependent hydrolase
MIESHQIKYGNSFIQYDVKFAARKTLEISVHPDLRVEVTAPLTTEPEAIESKVRKRASWILQQKRELELFLPHTPPRQYVSGETHRYLGRQYRLKLLEEPNSQPSVKLIRGFLIVTTIDKTDQKRVKQLVNDWYRKQAERVFAERFELLWLRFERLGVKERPTTKIRLMQSRWGSCTPAGTITLNLKLMQVPKSNIDYVLAHELCHVIEHNHSSKFYKLLGQVMPDWHHKREKLNDCEVA